MPGQYIPVRVQLEKGAGWTLRNYTISDRPDRNYYRLSIKLEKGGTVSRYFHEKLAEGDEIELGKPMGSFYLTAGTHNPLVLLSGGVGITPMMSMLEYIANREADRTLYFIHASLDHRVQPMHARLRELEKKLPNTTVSIHHTCPNREERPGIDFDHEGLIDLPFLKSVLNGVQADYYICGPVSFMEAMYAYLKEMGIGGSAIHYEFFGEGKALGAKPGFHDSKTDAYSVYFSKSDKMAYWNEAVSSILELAEAAGLSPGFSCRNGSCGTCETRITSGSVSYDPEPFVPVPNNTILSCCSRPSSDVTIEL